MEKIYKFIKNNRIIFLILVLISFFLFLGYDRLHHWDEVCYLRQAAEDSDFSCFGRNEFMGHVFLMDKLVDLFGTGARGLFLVDFSYALLVLAAVVINYMILKEIFGENKSYRIIIFLLFMPLTLYLSFKTLTGVPALFLASSSILFFIYSYRLNKYKILFLVISSLFLLLASITRLDSPIIVFSFMAGYLLISFKDKAIFKKKFYLIIAVSMISLLFFYLWISITELNPYTLHRTMKIGVETQLKFLPNFKQLNLSDKILPLFFVGSLFSFFIPFSFIGYKKKEFRLGIFWFLIAFIFPLLLLPAFETRYLYTSLIPLSILVFVGFEEFFSLIKKRIDFRYIKSISFSLIVIINLLFMPFMETQLSDKTYPKVIEEIDLKFPDSTLLLADGYADYSLLKFLYPDREFFIVQNVGRYYTRDYTPEEKRELFSKAYKDYYIADADNLQKYNNTKLFICYKRNTKLGMLRKLYFYISAKMGFEKEKKSDGVCGKTWIWNNPEVKLEKVMQKDKYEVYRVEVKG